MTQELQVNQKARWLRAALILGVGGAIFTYLAIWLLQFLIASFAGARLIRASEGNTIFLCVLGIVGFCGWLLLRRIFAWSFELSSFSVLGWLLAYLLLWTFGAAARGISLPMYLALWAIFGAAGGYVVSLRPSAQKASRQAAAVRQRSHVVHSSEFGRVPADTVVLLTQHVRHVTGPIVGTLPERVPQAVRDFTVRAVLDRAIRDWWENGNIAGLGTNDIADLRSFVALAAALASPTEYGGLPLQDAEAQAVYRAVLAALLDDWLANWNANGVDGPPYR